MRDQSCQRQLLHSGSSDRIHLERRMPLVPRKEASLATLGGGPPFMASASTCQGPSLCSSGTLMPCAAQLGTKRRRSTATKGLAIPRAFCLPISESSQSTCAQHKTNTRTAAPAAVAPLCSEANAVHRDPPKWPSEVQQPGPHGAAFRPPENHTRCAGVSQEGPRPALAFGLPSANCRREAMSALGAPDAGAGNGVPGVVRRRSASLVATPMHLRMCACACRQARLGDAWDSDRRRAPSGAQSAEAPPGERSPPPWRTRDRQRRALLLPSARWPARGNANATGVCISDEMHDLLRGPRLIALAIPAPQQEIQHFVTLPGSHRSWSTENRGDR